MPGFAPPSVPSIVTGQPNGAKVQSSGVATVPAESSKIDPTQDTPNEENPESDQAIMAMSDDDICRMVKADRDWAYSCFQPYYDKLPDFYKLYRSYNGKVVEEGRCNIFVPYVFTMVENMHARLMSAFFSQRPYIRVTPRDTVSGRGQVLSAQKAETLLDSQMDNPRFKRPIDAVIKMAEVFGTAYLKNKWSTIKGTRVKRKRLDIPGAPPGMSPYGPPTPEQVIIWDGPEAHPYAPGQILPDPTCGPDIQRANFVVEEDYKTKAELQQRQREGTYKNVDGINTSSQAPVLPSLNRMAAAQKATAQTPPTNRGMIKVWEAWYRNGWVFTIAEERTVLLRRKTPLVHGLYPYVGYHFIPVMDEPFGIGMAEILENLQEELNTSRNQRTDNINFSINKILKVRRGVYGDVAAQFPNKPGAIWEVERMDDAEWVRHPEINSSAFQSEDILKQDAQNACGVNDYSLGAMNSVKGQTATTATILAEQSASRFKLEIQNLGLSIAETGMQWNSLNAQFIPDEMIVPVEGNPAVNGGAATEIVVTPEDLGGNFKFSVQEAIASLDKRTEIENKKTVFAELKMNPNTNLPGLLRWFSRIMGASELEPFVGDPPPPLPMPVPSSPGMPGSMGPTPGGAKPTAALPPPSGLPPLAEPSSPLQSPTGRQLPTFPTTGGLIANG